MDPGRQKCGIAIVDRHGNVIRKTIIDSSALNATAGDWLASYPDSLIVLGDRTTSKQALKKLEPLGCRIELIDEDRSSLEGKYRYLRENTRGLARLIPIGLRIPDRPFDDYVAVILAERFLEKHKFSN